VSDCRDYRNEILEAASKGGPFPIEISEHLDSCDACRALYEMTEAVTRSVQALPMESPSQETTDRILAAARAEVESPAGSVPRSRRWQALGVAAASILLFIAGMWLLNSREEPLDPGEVAVLETKVDQGLSRVQTEMDTLWPERGWGTEDSRSVAARLNSFEERLERFRTRTRQETFPLVSVPENDKPRQEGRGESNHGERRYVS